MFYFFHKSLIHLCGVHMDYVYLLVYAFYKLPQDQWICGHITGNDLIVKHNTDTSHTLCLKTTVCTIMPSQNAMLHWGILKSCCSSCWADVYKISYIFLLQLLICFVLLIANK